MDRVSALALALVGYVAATRINHGLHKRLANSRRHVNLISDRKPVKQHTSSIRQFSATSDEEEEMVVCMHISFQKDTITA